MTPAAVARSMSKGARPRLSLAQDARFLKGFLSPFLSRDFEIK
jgi:hypothetical protein